ncbi:MAG TPA: NAD(P)/FAD-dependent oxidoreductase [Candidatus Baltobacteraceae bacterium]|jgi:geranylgeranyl reductase|nr:NAD(P)/FAD-dependent oxidoreductase [Candidatus Baltobacteraceae bacterium]
METVDFVVVGCGPAGATAAREAAAAGIETLVLEKDAVVGVKRVCAAGLRPGFCGTFDLPNDLVHCDTPRLALFDDSGAEHEVPFGPAHTTTREELDGTMGAFASRAGADVRTQSLFRSVESDGAHAVVEYADLRAGDRRRIRTRNVFLASGATVRAPEGLAYGQWENGLMTTLQYRVYLQRPAAAIAYRTLELHYYRTAGGRQIVAWMFPKRDHLAIGLGLLGKMPGQALREELAAFEARVRARLYPGVEVTARKEEGHLLYGGWPRPALSRDAVMIGGTAAGLVDATNGEGIFEAAMSGRIAAESVAAERARPAAAAARYARVVAGRFSRRLSHRVKLMRFLERVPMRYGVLFEQLAGTPRFADLLQKEDCERTMGDRIYLYGQALRFAVRTAAFAGR